MKTPAVQSLLLTALLLTPGAMAEVAETDRVPVAFAGGPGVVVHVGSQDPILGETARWCAEFIQRQGCVTGHENEAAMIPAGLGLVWALETLNAHPIARAVGVDVSFLETAENDAFVLQAVKHEVGTLLSIVGRNEAGVRAGVARAVMLLKKENGNLTFPAEPVTVSPFFPVRRLHVCVTGRIALGNDWCKQYGTSVDDRYADTLWTTWSDDRIRDLVESLWLLGFNSVEVPEIRGYRAFLNEADLARDVTPKLRVFMQAARNHGLQVSQFVWGQSLFIEGENLCWNDPAEQATMLAEYQRLGQTYGDLVDNIVVHVGDPGGCNRNGCDAYHTTQSIASALGDAYRARNPQVLVTLSTWANAGFWNHRTDPGFLDASLMPKDAGIALHRWYDAEQASLVNAAGRPCDIWGWYLSDFELALDWMLLMRRLDAYYTALPPEASRQIRAISTELNFQGWPHLINACVSAQKMLDPNRDLEAIEREFAAAVFGDANADAMVKVYQAIEENVFPERYYGFIPTTDCLPVVFGTADYNARLREARAAAARVDPAAFPPPRLTCDTSPAVTFALLRDNLELTALYSEATERAATARATGATPEDLQAILAEADAAAERYAMDPDHGRARQPLAKITQSVQ